MVNLAAWVSRGLIVLIGYVAATIALRYVPVDERPVMASTDLPPTVIEAVGSPSIEEISRDAAQQHIFGIAGSKPAIQIAKPDPVAQITKLNLSLIGVYSAQPMDRALAIVSANGKPEEVFRIGETITGRAKLLEVLPTEIVIDNGGKREIVKLPEKVASTGRTTGLENLPGAAVQNQPSPTANNGAPIELPESPREIRDTLARNPAMLNKLVSAVPYRENGRILGYRLTPKQSGGLLETNGILPGDVVTRVNGIALANQKNGIRALRKLVKASSVDLTILRDGVELPISIPLE